MPTSKRTRSDERRIAWRLAPGAVRDLVLEELANRIVRGDLAVGSLLPTEPVLCQEFGFSQTVIREALKLLEERRLVRIEQGPARQSSRRSSGTC